jgi:hypothetical protein
MEAQASPEMWDIEPGLEEDVLLLMNNDDTAHRFQEQYGSYVQVTSADAGPYFVEFPEVRRLSAQGSVERAGLVGGVTVGEDLTGRVSHLLLDSDSGGRYTAFVEQAGVDFTQARRFVASDVIHEGRYFLRKVKVEFAQDPNDEEWRIPIQLPLVRVHRPHRKGCSAEAVVSVKRSTDVDATFEFLGIKGGVGKGFTVQLSSTYRAGTKCRQETVPATLLVTHGVTLVDGQAVAYGARYGVVDVQLDRRVSSFVPAAADICGHHPTPSPQPPPTFWTTFDRRDVSANDANNDDQSAQFGSTGYFSVGLGAEFGKAPLKLSVQMKRTLETEYTVSTSLSGGGEYLRFPASLSAGAALPFEICWSVLDN